MRNHTFFRAVFATQGILTYFARLYYMRRGGESAQTISRTQEERFSMPLKKAVASPCVLKLRVASSTGFPRAIYVAPASTAGPAVTLPSPPRRT